MRIAGETDVSLACRRSRRRGARRAGAARRDKAAALKLMRKLLKKQGFAPTCGHRQAAIVRRAFGELGPHCPRARAAERTTGLRTRISRRGDVSEDAALQVARSAQRFLRPRRRPQHIQSSTSSGLPPHAPPLPCRGGRTNGATRSRQCDCLLRFTPFWLPGDQLTMRWSAWGKSPAAITTRLEVRAATSRP